MVYHFCASHARQIAYFVLCCGSLRIEQNLAMQDGLSKVRTQNSRLMIYAAMTKDGKCAFLQPLQNALWGR